MMNQHCVIFHKIKFILMHSDHEDLILRLQHLVLVPVGVVQEVLRRHDLHLRVLLLLLILLLVLALLALLLRVQVLVELALHLQDLVVLTLDVRAVRHELQSVVKRCHLTSGEHHIIPSTPEDSLPSGT